MYLMEAELLLKIYTVIHPLVVICPIPIPLPRMYSGTDVPTG